MRRREAMQALFLAGFLLLTGCTAPDAGPRKVHKSLYLGKRYLKFVMDNGPSYKDEKLRDGSVIHYWRSDYGNLLAIATGRDDSYPDYCELALKTNPQGIVESIDVLEESIQCNGALK
ncbi:hypothetical protein [Nitratifractor sp.]|uniref:hypothetical protein n=1 Tax=Nitratifractor sp. TaxID=2268144 RepID=UPI0025ED8C4F|nr:hypothetical protein [Nitratifractor sp.]